MRNAQLAEWILSLVTSPERAAATVGDLMENASELGMFWLGVLRTAGSLLWREFAEDPANLMGLAFRGFLLQFALLLAFFALFLIPVGLAGLIAGLFWNPTANVFDFSVFATVGQVLGIGLTLLVSFQVGRWMARRSPGRELAPVIAFTILDFAISSAAGMIFLRQDTLSQFLLSLVLGFVWSTLYQIPAFAGAVWVRTKQTPR